MFMFAWVMIADCAALILIRDNVAKMEGRYTNISAPIEPIGVGRTILGSLFVFEWIQLLSLNAIKCVCISGDLDRLVVATIIGFILWVALKTELDMKPHFMVQELRR